MTLTVMFVFTLDFIGIKVKLNPCSLSRSIDDVSHDPSILTRHGGVGKNVKCPDSKITINITMIRLAEIHNFFLVSCWSKDIRKRNLKEEIFLSESKISISIQRKVQ